MENTPKFEQRVEIACRLYITLPGVDPGTVTPEELQAAADEYIRTRLTGVALSIPVLGGNLFPLNIDVRADITGAYASGPAPTPLPTP